MKNSRIIFIAILIFCSCSSEKEKKEEAEKIVVAAKELQKAKIIGDLVSKYSIQYQMDTVNFQFSQDCKPVIMSQYQLIDEFEINDIYEKDSTEYIRIRMDNYPYSQYKLYFDFPISKYQETIIKDKNNDNILVVSISEMKRISRGSDDIIPGVDTETSEDFSGKGKIVDIVTISKY